MLSAQRLTRRFGDRVAVEDLSFDLVPGEIFALLGPNGAGKTTTLRLLCGLIAPSSGSVSLDGELLTPESAQAHRRRIGFLTETPGLWDRLTVRQNLSVYARLYSLPDPGKAVDEALELFSMRDRAGDRTAQLSKGLKQRVALARALLHDPAIVLLDEPTAGLDPESARDVRDLVLRLRHSRRAVMICTHNLDEAERVADHVAVLRSRLVALGTPDALRARVFKPRVRIAVSEAASLFAAGLGSAGADDVRVEGNQISIALNGRTSVPALVRHLVDGGANIESVVREEPTLEEVYLHLLHEHTGPS